MFHLQNKFIFWLSKKNDDHYMMTYCGFVVTSLVGNVDDNDDDDDVHSKTFGELHRS